MPATQLLLSSQTHRPLGSSKVPRVYKIALLPIIVIVAKDKNMKNA